MKNRKKNIFTIILFILYWTLIVISRFDPVINQIILKILIPSIFLIIIYYEKLNLISNTPLLFFSIFSIWASFSVFYTVNLEMTLKYLQVLAGNILLWYIVFRLVMLINNENRILLTLGSVFLFHAFLGIFIPPKDELSIRMQGIYNNANSLGFAMWYGIIIFMYFYLISKKKFYKIINAGILFILIWVLIFTASRKSFLATVISISLIIYYKNIIDIRKIFIYLPIIIISYFYLSNYILDQTPLGMRLDPDYVERSADYRAGLISEGMTFFLEHPFIGIGLGSFTTYSITGKMSHNDYIEILSSMGSIGLILYIIIFWYYYKESKLLLRYDETFYFGVISFAFFIGYLILGMGRPAFLDPVAIIVFATFQGINTVKVNQIKKNILENKRLIDKSNLKLNIE